MKLKISIFYIFLSLLVWGCSADKLDYVNNDSNTVVIDNNHLIVQISLDASGLSNVSTRDLTQNPDYKDLHLYVLEFIDNGNPLSNPLSAIYEPDEETPFPTDTPDRINFTLTLNLTSKPRILHFIALPKDDIREFEYGVEASVMPNLKTGYSVSEDGLLSNPKPAYWRRISFPDGYASQLQDGTLVPSNEIEQIKHIALLRNFACITVNSAVTTFNITGVAIINNPTSGTICPWNANRFSFPEFLDSSNQQILDYKQISASYNGIVPPNVNLTNRENEAEKVVFGEGSQYIYERPFNSIYHTFIVIRGKFVDDSQEYFYKLDIGQNDQYGVFRYYNILRNFNYNITINSIAPKGYKTLKEALDGIVYNNFSFDIELSQMLNISDGDEVVFVNFTTAVLTDPEEQQLVFKYRYRKLINTTGPTFNNGDVQFLGLDDGEVIKEYTLDSKDEPDGWRALTMTINPAQQETKSQSFIIVKPSGLGRTINLILHRKWSLMNVREYSGTGENYEGPGSENIGKPGVAGGESQAPLTIFFDIPDNLEEAMFPLVFTLESDRQNIENNPIGALIVTSGPSGFNNSNDIRIKYEKSITWTEYNLPISVDNPYESGTQIDNGNGTYTHRVRCRFLTTTSLGEFDEFNKSTTRVLITNPNFENTIVTFTRDKNTPTEDLE